MAVRREVERQRRTQKAKLTSADVPPETVFLNGCSMTDPPPSLSPAESREDIVIRGGIVVDGTGAPGRLADVAIRDGRIAAIGEITSSAARVIEAKGKVVAPGFIDIKTHSDWTLPLMPLAESKVRQGVTTEVVGHCGYSCAPCLPGKAEELKSYLGPSAPWLDFAETSFADYARTYPPTAVNRVMLVGHNTLRLMVMGLERRPPTPPELARIKSLVEEALDAGAFGLSSGLFTPPGAYAAGDEMVELGRVLAHYGARYFTHLRDEAGTVFDAVAEAIEFGERCGVHVQIVHAKVSGTNNWGQAEKFLQLLRAARERDIGIDCDEYPYTAASNPLRNLMPPWLQEGGFEATLARLRDPGARARIRREVAASGLNNFGHVKDWDAVRISISPNLPQYTGKTIAEIALSQRKDPLDAALDYIAADRGQTRIVVESISEDDVRAFVRAPEVMVGSDGNSVAPYGTTGQGKPHPRFYGTFARILGKYVREEAVVPLETAIRKMTDASAAALGLSKRGQLRAGFHADVTVFDPATIAERATYDDPHQFAVGIEAVIVNGVPVLERGEHTGATPGEMLRAPLRHVR
jgi:N-acyl-D-aspartate/D-glutamate deacylase